MKNLTGKPYAFKELDQDGFWCIYFDPSPKLDGHFYYEQLTGPIDVDNAELIVRLLNEHNQKEEGTS